MGLTNGYRTFRNNYIDDGEQLSVIMTPTFTPDFKNRHTLQNWTVSPTSTSRTTDPEAGVRVVEAWVGGTLKESSLHEISILNNTASDRFIYFNPQYQFIDENQPLPETSSNLPVAPIDLATYKIILVPANSTAHFITTANNQDGNLVLVIRAGSQDSR